MDATIDRAGRLVIPKPLREAVGIVPGSRVELLVDGSGIRVQPVPAEGVVDEAGFLVIPAGGVALDDDSVRDLRRVDQR